MFENGDAEPNAVYMTGELSVAVPIPWSFISNLLICLVVAGLIFLSLGRYSRVEVASGNLSPAAGVSQIITPKLGTVASLSVVEGQYVKKGTPVAELYTDIASPGDFSSTNQINAALEREEASLASQEEAIQSAYFARRARARSEARSIESEIVQIKAQIDLQTRLIKTAEVELERAHAIADKGFVSRRDLSVREESLIAREQTLAELQQKLASRSYDLAASQLEPMQFDAQSKGELAAISAARARLEQQVANARVSRSYVIRAPISGTVTALVVRVGQSAKADTPLMAIIPENSRFVAELLVPNSAIGFVKRGDQVEVAVEAFPYDRFGTIEGQVETVPLSSVEFQSAERGATAGYPVRVRLEPDSVLAFGGKKKLKSGMKVSARIVTEQRSLIEWLFEPLITVGRR